MFTAVGNIYYFFIQLLCYFKLRNKMIRHEKYVTRIPLSSEAELDPEPIVWEWLTSPGKSTIKKVFLIPKFVP